MESEHYLLNYLDSPTSQHAQTHRIFLDGYGVLDVRIVIFKISSFKLQNARLLLIFTKYSIITAILKYKRLKIGLFDFIKSSYPFKVNVKERTLVDGEVSLLKETEDRVIPPLAEKAKTNPFATLPQKKKNPSNGWKTRVTLQRLVTLGTLQENIGYGSAVAVVDAFVSESATPSPNHEYKDESDFVQDGDAETRLASQRFVVLSSDSPIEPLNTRHLLHQNLFPTHLLRELRPCSMLPP
ncbi:hypothetical protein Tco_1301352 [Tanacetum coccineum]